MYGYDELYHFGVKGMKWGVRRAKSLQDFASGTRKSADEEEALSNYYKSKGKTRKAEKHARIAAGERAEADRYQKKADKLFEKAEVKAEKKMFKQSVKDVSKSDKVTNGLRTAERILNSTGGPKVKLTPNKRMETHAERSRRESEERRSQLGKAPNPMNPNKNAARI